MINIIDNEFNYLGLVDDYKSFIAAKDYHSIGNFELHLNAKSTNAEYLQKENIIFTDEDNAFIVLYRYANTVDNSLIIKGLQLKSYLARWLVFPLEGEEVFKVKSNVETVIKEFVRTTLDRKGITNIVIADNQNRGSEISYQSRYKNLAEELEKISVVSGAGWNIKLDLENKQFIFDIEIGKDRTVEQSINTQAIFSTEYDNISEQELIESRLDYANKAIVAGQGEGVNRVIKVVGDSEGLESYELFVDARDLENEDELPDRGLQKLSEVAEVISFDSKVIPNSNLVYKKDFNLGDMVTNQNRDWDIRLNRRIVGITEIYEKDGFNLEVLFGNSLPTIMDKIKRLEDKPIREGGAGSGGNNYQLGNVKNLRVKEDDKSIELFWEDPSNIEIEGMEGTIYTLARWDGTKVVRKKGSFPINENDGILVVDSKTHNQFKDVGFIDTGLENEIEYYYKLFPYTEFETFTNSENNTIKGIPLDGDDRTGSPGPRKLIGGDMDAGFFGEVPSSKLWNGTEISSLVGIVQGANIFTDENWLKFVLDGKILFKTKKPIKYSIAWSTIDNAGCSDGSKTISKDGTNFKVRLLRGAVASPLNNNASDRDARGSEWNRLMLPIHIKAKDGSWVNKNHADINVPYWGVDYTDEDLHTSSIYGYGSGHICPENVNVSTGSRTYRGVTGASVSGLINNGSDAYLPYGWSPVLEVIEE